MELPSNLQNRVTLQPGVVVCYTNAVGFRSFGIIVSAVNGTFEVAYRHGSNCASSSSPWRTLGPSRRLAFRSARTCSRRISPRPSDVPWR